MNNSFLFQLPESILILLLYVLIILSQWGGFKVKQSHLKQNPDIKDGLGTVEGSLLGLLALLLSFTFSMSASKYEARRQIIIEEANNIGTVILRCDLYRDTLNRQSLRAEMREYLEERIAYYQAGTNVTKSNIALQKSNHLGLRIWNNVSRLAKDNENIIATQQMVPALNSMIDIVTTRDAGNSAHIPDSILWLLFLLTLVGGFLIGYSFNGDRINWVIITGFAFIMVLTIYLIFDLDRPRQGVINMDQTHIKMIELRSLF